MVREWKVGSPADIPFDRPVSRRDDYHPGRSLKLESAYPILQGFKDSVAFGARVNFSDPVQLYREDLSASFSPSPDLPGSQEVHLEAALSRPGLDGDRPLQPGRLLRPVRADAEGPQGLRLRPRPQPHVRLRPARQVDLTVDATYWGGLDTLPDYQNVAAPV